MTTIIICNGCGKRIKRNEVRMRTRYDQETTHYCRKCYPLGVKTLLLIFLGIALFIVIVFAICSIGVN